MRFCCCRTHANDSLEKRIKFKNEPFISKCDLQQLIFPGTQNLLKGLLSYDHCTTMIHSYPKFPKVLSDLVIASLASNHRLSHMVLLPIVNHSCHSAVAPIEPGVVTQIINTLLFLLSVHQSSSQLDILITALQVDAPKIWNELPHDVRSPASVASFRKKLKTYLFAKTYPP